MVAFDCISIPFLYSNICNENAYAIYHTLLTFHVYPTWKSGKNILLASPEYHNIINHSNSGRLKKKAGTWMLQSS